MELQAQTKPVTAAVTLIEKLTQRRSSTESPEPLTITPTSNEKLTLTSHNADRLLQFTIDGEIKNEEGAAFVYPEAIAKILKPLKGETIRLKLRADKTDTNTPNGVLNIKHGKSSFNLPLTNAPQHEPRPAPTRSTTRVNASELRDLIRTVQHSAGSNKVGAELAYVRVEFNETETVAIATDGYRIALANNTCTHETTFHINIPVDNLTDILNILEVDEEVTVTADDKDVRLHNDAFTLQFAQPARDVFPAYRTVTENTSKHDLEFEVNAVALAQAMKRARILPGADDHHRASVTLENNTLLITAAGPNGTSNETLPVESINKNPGSDFKYGVNARYLEEALHRVPEKGNVTISANASNPRIMKYTTFEGTYQAFIAALNDRTG